MAEYIVRTDRGRFRVKDVTPASGPVLDRELKRRLDAHLKTPDPQIEPIQELTTGQQIVRQAALPTALGAIGAGVGTAVGTPLLGGVIGGIAAAGGEAINQYLLPEWTGAEESPFQIALAGAAPLVGPVGREVVRSLPGATAGLQQFLQKSLGPRGEVLRELFGSTPETTQMLFKNVTGGRSLFVGTDRMRPVVTQLEREIEASAFASPRAAGIIRRARAMVGDPGATGPSRMIPFEDFRVSQSDLGALVRELSHGKKTRAAGAAKALYKATWEEIDDTLSRQPPEIAGRLKLAIESTKREELGRFIANAFRTSSPARIGRRNIDVDGVLTKLMKDQDMLERLVPKAEIDDVLKRLSAFAQIPVPAKVAGEGLRGIVAPERIAIGTGLGLLGRGMGMELETSVGTGVVGILGVEVISRLMTTAFGRAAVAGMSRYGTTIDEVVNALGQMGRTALSADTPSSTSTIGSPPPPMPPIP